MANRSAPVPHFLFKFKPMKQPRVLIETEEGQEYRNLMNEN